MGNKGIPWSAEQYAKARARHGTLAERFARNVEFDTNGGCWLWTGVLLKSTGYGQIQDQGEVYLAHRASWFLAHGESPTGLNVCHRCDVRACVNPDHLFLGTHNDNMLDMTQKGRSAHGSRHRWAKLTEDDVRQIHRLRAAGFLQREIADRYGVSQVKVSQILRGKSWAHVV